MKKEDEQGFICDNPIHDKEMPAFSQLMLHSWYGSKYEMTQGSIHLCDSCAKTAQLIIQNEFGIKNFLKNVEEF